MVINYCMDVRHPVLSHQVQAVNALASEFDQVLVLTGQLGVCEVLPNVTVMSTNWVAKQPIRNSMRFLSIAIPIVITQRFVSVFSHMTEVQSALIAPVIKVLGIRHYLWYAHTTRSKYLVWCYFWLTNNYINSRILSFKWFKNPPYRSGDRYCRLCTQKL